MTIKLYEMAAYYKEALESIEEHDDEMDAFEILDAIDVSIQEKVESIGDIIKGYLVTAAALKAEADRLKERAASETAQAENLMKYLEHVMKSNDFTELKGLKHTFKITTSESLKCIDPNVIPAQFKKVEYKPDISGLKAHLKKAYDDKGIKLVKQPSKKPKGQEMLFTELNESLRDMGFEFEINKKVTMK